MGKEYFSMKKRRLHKNKVNSAFGTKSMSYTEPMQTGWKPPLAIRSLGKEVHEATRRQCHISIEGDNIPPPIQTFKEMRFSKPVLKELKAKGIRRPTPIQMQGLPIVLSGRDMIGITSTRFGKTLVFVLPLIMLALQEEERMPLVDGEGPLGIVVCPFRELAQQTLDVVEEFTSVLAQNGHPHFQSMLYTSGIDIKSLLKVMEHQVHIVVATPGQLRDMPTKMNLCNCKYLTLNEVDSLVNLGFEEDIRNIIRHFQGQKQILLFSTTMPKRIQNFVKDMLLKPVLVTVSQADATKLDVGHAELNDFNISEWLRKRPPPMYIWSDVCAMGGSN